MTGARNRVFGRDRLHSDLAGHLAGPRATVVLVGEPGVGKTTVWAQALIETVADWSWSTRCLEAEAELGLAVLGDFLTAVPHVILTALSPPQRRVVEVICFRDEIRPGDAPIGDRLLGTVVSSVLSALAAAGSVSIGIDDLQWCDATSFAAFAFALHRLDADAPLTVLAGARPGMVAQLPDAISVDVAPLDVAATRSLVHSIAPAAGTDLVDRLVARSEGNPYFATELSRHVAAGGDDADLPQSLRAALRRRLASMSAPTRDALVDVAVRGEAESDIGSVDDLQAAFDHDIVVKEGTAVRFTHPLLARAVLDAVPPERIRRAHRDAAAASLDVVAAALHRAQADPPSDALAAELDRAAALAAARGDTAGAYRAADLALELTPGGARPHHRLLTLALRANFGSVDRDIARAVAREAVESAVEPEQRYRALMLLADAQRDIERAAAFVTEAADVPGISANLAASARAYLATMLGMTGRAREGLQVVRAGLVTADPVSPAWAELTAISASLSRHIGEPDPSDRLTRALRIARSAASAGANTLPYAIFVATTIAYCDSRFADADALMDEAYARAEEHGDFHVPYLYRTYVALRRGEVATAAELQVGFAETVDATRTLPLTALIRAWQGDRDGFESAIAQGRAALSVQGAMLMAECDYIDGFGRLLFDGPTAAWPLLRAAAAALDAVDYREPSHPPVLQVAVEAAAGVGDLAAAETLCARLERDTAGVQSRFGAAGALHARASIANARGDVSAALDGLAAAHAGFTELGVPLEAARSQLALGSLLRRVGRRRDARAQLGAAHATFLARGALGPATTAAAELARISGRRTAPDGQLTAAERAVTDLVATGLRNADVAARLQVSVKTVETHLGHAYRKLGATNRTELAAVLASRSTP